MSMYLKRHYPILLALILVLGFFALVLGGQRVIAYTTRADSASTAGTKIEGVDIHNDVDLFDDTVIHDIQVIMDEGDYQTMISTYQQTGEKDYFHADVIIDGVRVTDVGVRLKGNASLQTALGGMGMRLGAAPGGNIQGFEQQDRPERADPNAVPNFNPQNLPEGFDPNNLPEQGIRPQAPGGVQQPGGGAGQGFAFPGGDGLNALSQQSGEVKIPMLIKFDEYIDGQTYQGYGKLSLRTYGVTYDEAMLEEPLTNFVFDLMDLPATRTAYSGLQVNGNEVQFYVISEVVDDPLYLARNFDNTDGILFKAEVGSSLTYIDDDPSSYARSFSQETRVNDADMAPLIAFARFLTQSDDATFERNLPEWLDIDSFATYLAITNLVVNNDSIAGMNNNYYLYYDEQGERFTLLYWDGNESMGGLGMGTSAEYDLYFSGAQGMRNLGGSQNILLERFLANSTFRALYEEKLKDVYAKAFTNAALTGKLEEISALVHSVNPERSLVNMENYEQSVEKMLTFLDQRMDYLASTDLLGK